jgi:hypothetical protein
VIITYAEAIDIHNPVQSKKVSGFFARRELGLMFSIVDSLIVSVFK